jgi:hypothetical protein
MTYTRIDAPSRPKSSLVERNAFFSFPETVSRVGQDQETASRRPSSPSEPSTLGQDVTEGARQSSSLFTRNGLFRQKKGLPNLDRCSHTPSRMCADSTPSALLRRTRRWTIGSTSWWHSWLAMWTSASSDGRLSRFLMIHATRNRARTASVPLQVTNFSGTAFLCPWFDLRLVTP